jgi:hypothetical protein
VGIAVGESVGTAVGAAVGAAVGLLVGVDVPHKLRVQKVLVQSAPERQLLPGAHFEQAGPPQSVSVSSPPNMPSIQEAGVGAVVGATVGSPSAFESASIRCW